MADEFNFDSITDISETKYSVVQMEYIAISDSLLFQRQLSLINKNCSGKNFNLSFNAGIFFIYLSIFGC